MRQSNEAGDGCETPADYEREHEASYWRRFYKQINFNEGSPFFEYTTSNHETPRLIIDIGCGDGRDSFAFARSGKQVLGIDRSDAGVDRAQRRSESEHLDAMLQFALCDVSDAPALRELITNTRGEMAGEPVCFYMRFFLHSIPEEVQDTLISTLTELARRGDMFAAEFRTDKDENNQHVFGDSHYRRYQNADDFSKRLSDEYRWRITFETEEKGLSPYKDEDPVLYRVIAVRP